tara:strand:- start:36 stop:152 length:117 start_codon:yes stop_codon:yes gene_type:complete
MRIKKAAHLSGLARLIKGVYDPETTSELVDEPDTDLSK